MAARAIWKGVLALPGARVAVKLYAAVEDRKVHFHLLHDRDLARVEQRMVDPHSGEVVPHEEIRKGYEVDGELVALTEEELATLQPEPSREVELLRFVPDGAIDPQWYDRPYWLGPDGAATPYFGLATALRRSERQGVARWTMRGRSYAGALRPEGEHLMLITLRHAGEVVSSAELPAAKGRAFEPRELELARQLVEALAGDFDPAAYRDSYRARLRELIAAKAAGRKVEVVKLRPRRQSADLEQALVASLERTRRGAGERRRAAS